MARDYLAEAMSWPTRFWERLTTTEAKRPAVGGRRGIGLSAKLLFLTLIFVMLAEVLIFVPRSPISASPG